MAQGGQQPGFASVTATFIVPELRAELQFLQQLFGATLEDLYELPDGSIVHVELLIRGSRLMCAQPMEGWPANPGIFTLSLDEGREVDALYRRALELGATSLKAPTDEFYGHRAATVRSPGGNRWSLSAVVEDVSKEEAHRRLVEAMKG